VDRPTQRWCLLRKSTNEHGVTHFTVTCRDEIPDGDNSDYEELLRLLKGAFGAVEDGKHAGPYSIHQYMKLGQLRFGIVLDTLGWLDLYATEKVNAEVMESVITELLHALNCPHAAEPEQPNAEPGEVPDQAT
jgi:hypothetical protein